MSLGAKIAARARVCIRSRFAIASRIAMALRGSLFLSLTHVLDVESNSLFRPSQSESAPARSGNGQTDAFPRQVSGVLLGRATNQSLQKSLNLSGLNSVYRTVCWIFL